MRKYFTRIQTRIGSLHMFKKLSIGIIILMLISFQMIHRVYSNIYQRDIIQSNTMLFNQAVMSYDNELQQLLNNTDSVLKVPLYSSTFQQELAECDHISSESIQELYQQLSTLGTSELWKYVVLIYNAEGAQVFANASLGTTYMTKMNYENWIATTNQMDGITCILPIFDPEGKFSVIIAKSIRSTTTFKNIGFVAICVPKQILDNVSVLIQNQASARAVIFNSFGDVVYDSEGADIAVPSEIEAAIQTQLGSRPEKIDIDTENYYGCMIGENYDRYRILVFSEKQVLFAGLHKTQRYIDVISWVVALSSIAIILYYSKSITKPLLKITQLMERVQTGDWDVRFHAKYYDEIGLMGRTFNVMLDRMDEMVENTIAANTAKKQAEIDALQSQINPHFMYNTLESFRMMALEKNDEELADLIFRFGKMMRYNIASMNEITTIQQELAYLQYYIDIQNSRYDKKIELQQHIPGEMLEYPIIKLLLQPIAENSIQHGQLGRKNHGIISIRMYQKQQFCLLELSDNGVGISAERLHEIQNNLRIRYASSTSAKSIGLRNVNERIKLYYGEDYGIYLDSHLEMGTVVTISLPYKEQGGEFLCGKL